MTTTPPTAGDDLIELVRSADPLERGCDPVADDRAEALLRDILAAPREQRRPRPRPSTSVVVRLVALAAAVAAALAAITTLTGDDRGGVTPASAAVIRHALAAVAQPSGTILHVDMRGSQDNGDGTTISWRDESWQQNSAPYDRRQVETNPDGITAESANVGDSEQVYDPASNTIYASTPTSEPNGGFAPQAQRQHLYRFSPGPTPNTLTLRLMVLRVSSDGYKLVPGRQTLVVTSSQAKALRNGSAIVTWKRVKSGGGHGHPRFRPTVASAPAATATPDCAAFGSQDFGDQILTLLRSCGAQLVGHATIAGRDTLELRSKDGHITYYVDASSFAPVQLDTTGTDGGTSLRFETYQLLPGGDANAALLSLTAQHPSATVDRDPADYRAAEQRLFPDG